MFKCIAKYIDQVYLIEWYEGRFRAHNKKFVELESKIDFMNEEYGHLERYMSTLQRRCVKMGVDPNPDHIDNPHIKLDMGLGVKSNENDPFGSYRKVSATGAGPKDNVVFLEGNGHD